MASEALKTALAELHREKGEIESKTAAFRKERDKLHAEIGKKLAEVEKLTAKIKEIEGTRYFELHQEISRIAKAGGGRSMSDNVT